MQFEQLVSARVTEARAIRNARLLHSTDRLLGSVFFLGKGVDEVAELGEELHKPREEFDPKKVRDEANDILVFAQTALEAAGITVSDRITDIPDRIEVDDSSNLLDRIEETLQEIIERPAAFSMLLQQLLALTKPYSRPGVNILSSMKETVKKVTRNRPAELYDTYSARYQRELEEEEQLKKYFYLEAATRLIRNRCGNLMKRCHWEPIASFFDDFENAQRNLANLKSALEMMPKEQFTQHGWYVANEYVWKTLNGAILHDKGILRFQQ